MVRVAYFVVSLGLLAGVGAGFQLRVCDGGTGRGWAW
jgi:hypothetical protein